MQGPPYTPWEIRSASLSGRSDTLKTIAHDKAIELTAEERAALESVAEKLTAEARAVVRKG